MTAERSSEHEVRRCPVCGAPVAAAASACNYCASPLATVRCAQCFVMNAYEALHCSGCGSALGLEPIPAAPDGLVCPACRVPCVSYAGHTRGGGLLVECGRCGGQFVEHALLEELLERREVHRPVERAPPRPHNPLARPVRYVGCPRCGVLMNRNNFGGASGIVVDVCSRHGVWFDAGELPRVLAFVAAGGLVRARRRAALAQKESQRRDRIEAAMQRPGLVEPAETPWPLHFAEGVMELLDVIVDVIKKR